MDMSADVLYLANHYSQQPYMGDEAGIGSARSHGVVVLPVDGPTTVVVDVPWWRRDLVVADDVRPSMHVVETAAESVRAAGLGRGRIALVGASYMTASAYIGLGDLFPVDCYGSYGGYFFDFARSRCVGDEPAPEQRALLEAVIEGVETICAGIAPGMTAGEVHRIGADWLAQSDVVASIPKEEAE